MIMTIDEEVKRLVDFLSHPAGFNVNWGGLLCIRPIDECCPPVRWEVDWEETIDNQTVDSYKAFDSLQEAAQYFVEKRRYLLYGLDIEVELMKEEPHE